MPLRTSAPPAPASPPKPAIKPRVHWISPLPPAETDIAHYTARILPELAEQCDLVLWTDAPTWDRSLETHCEVRRLDPDRITPADFARAGQTSGGADVLFIHIGNSWVFHSGLLRLARRMPSIIVLHDLALQEMLFESMANHRFPEHTYLSEMERWHGARGRELAQNMLAGRIRPLDVATQMPGFEITLDKAAAVLAHTPAAYEAAVQAGMPAYLLDLPFRPSAQPTPAQRVQDGPLKLVQFGYIGLNRRLEQVLEALAPLREEVDWQFDIMGNVWDPAYLMRRAAEMGIAERVQIHGFVEEPVLDAKLAEAHLVFNLRFPTMGEASGSQLRIWNASAASVVTDLGWYGSLPDEAVFKIPLEQEQAALQTLMRRIAADRSLCTQVGAAGRAQLELRHTPKRYAQGIRHVAEHMARDTSTAIKARAARAALARFQDVEGLLARALEPRM